MGDFWVQAKEERKLLSRVSDKPAMGGKMNLCLGLDWHNVSTVKWNLPLDHQCFCSPKTEYDSVQIRERQVTNA